MTVHALLVSVVMTGAMTGAPAAASAADTKAQCLAAHEESQLLRQRSELVAARATLRMCARSECPKIVQTDCVQWLDEVERSVPTVIFAARSDAGDVIDAQVYVDGALVAKRLDGKPFDIEPGAHNVRFEITGKAPRETRVLIKDGEKGRTVSVSWETPKGVTLEARAEDAGAPRPVPLSVWLLGGTAIAGAGVFTAFGLLGNKSRGDLDATCAPFCTEDDVRPSRTRYLVADIGLGVGIASAVGAVVLYVLRPTEVPRVVGMARPRAPGAPDSFAKPRITGLGGAPAQGGAAFQLSGSF